MFSDEIRCCLLHLRYINIEITKFRVKPYERVRKLVVPDAILIRLDRIAKPRMKIIRHGRRRQTAEQEAVSCSSPLHQVAGLKIGSACHLRFHDLIRLLNQNRNKAERNRHHH